MTNLQARLRRLETALGADVGQEAYRDRPGLSAAANAHFRTLHDFLGDLGPAGVVALLDRIAKNGCQLVQGAAE